MVSVAVRVVTALYFGDWIFNLPGTFDQISYHQLALRVLNGHGFSFGQTWWPLTPADAPTAHWSFIYTLYLTGVYALFGPHALAARLIQAVVVGVLHPYLAFLLGRRLFGRSAGLVAAALTAVYAYFVYYAATLMTEPFYITAILAGLYLSMRLVDQAASSPADPSDFWRLALGLGLVLSVAVLLRQLFLLLVPFIFLWAWWAARRRGGLSLIRPLALSGLVIGAMIMPFTIYNSSRFGRFVLLNTNAGYAFFWANHPIYGTDFEPILPPNMGSYQNLIPDELRHLDEAALDQELLKRGLQFVLDDPLRYIQLSFSRIPDYFMFWPSSHSDPISNLARVTSFGLLWPFMLYGLIRSMVRPAPTSEPGTRRHSNTTPPHAATGLAATLSTPDLLLLLFVALYTTIHLLSWALIRYRLPVDAVMLVFAGLALVDLTERYKAWRQKTRPALTSASAEITSERNKP